MHCYLTTLVSLYIFKELLFQKIEVSCICGVEVGFVFQLCRSMMFLCVIFSYLSITPRVSSSSGGMISISAKEFSEI